MKTQWIKFSATFLLAMVMVLGMDAQNRGGRGQGPCGEGYGSGGAGRGEGYGSGGAGRGQGYAQGQSGRYMADRLDLSEEQQEQMDAVRLEHYKTMKPLRNEMAEIRLEKQNLITADDPDLNAINKVIDQQTDLNNKIQKIRAEHRVEVRNLLTEEQRMQLDMTRNRRGGPKGAARMGDGCRGGGRGWS